MRGVARDELAQAVARVMRRDILAAVRRGPESRARSVLHGASKALGCNPAQLRRCLLGGPVTTRAAERILCIVRISNLGIDLKVKRFPPPMIEVVIELSTADAQTMAGFFGALRGDQSRRPRDATADRERSPGRTAQREAAEGR